MERVVNRNKVSINIDFQGPLEKMSFKSSLIGVLCPGGGVMRSLVEAAVIIKKIIATTANKPVAIIHPFWSSPCPNLLTKGNVKPCTKKAAPMAKIKRMEEMLVRSLMLLVITPCKAE